MRLHIAVFIAFACTLSLSAQEVGSADDVTTLAAELLAEMVADGNISDETSADVSEIADIINNPLDLNSVTTEDLNKVIVLTDRQINGIINYRNANKKFETLQELLFVDGFDYSNALTLQKLFCIRPLQIASNKINNELLSRVQFVLPKQKGFFPKNDTTPPPYLGKPFSLLVRNKAEYQHWQVGFTAESDMGEPMFSEDISLTDFTSAYLQYKNERSLLRQVIVGHFFAQYGEGLGLWTGFAPNSSTIETSISRRNTALRPTLSANESDYLRGVALSLRHLPFRADFFLSHTDNDASILSSKDSLSADRAQSIQTDGYHRTQSEIASRHNISQILAGGYLFYSARNTSIGLGGNHWHGSRSLGKDDDLYKLFRPQTDNITTIHANVKGYYSIVSVYGEMTWQSTDALAGTCGLDLNFENNISMTLAFRKFGNRYYCIKQNPYSRASQPGGETGFYVALSAYPFAKTSLLANVDVYRNIWLEYQKPFPHNGYKTMLKIVHQINNYNTLTLRMRFEEKEKASQHDNNKYATLRKTYLRCQWETQPATFFKLRTTLEKSHCREIGGTSSDGFWLGQEFRLSFTEPKCGTSLLIAHFDTDNYDSRIYTSLPNMPYAMSFPSFSDKGFVIVGLLKWSPCQWLNMWAHVNHVRYSERQTMSSGNNLIDVPYKTEIKLQAILKLSHIFRKVHAPTLNTPISQSL